MIRDEHSGFAESPSVSKEWMARTLDRYPRLGAWDRFHLHMRLRSCPYGFLASLLPEQGVLFDYGCGFGHFGWALHELKPGLSYYGWDPDPRKGVLASESMASNENAAPKISSDPEKIFPDSPPFFDAITVLDVLYLIPQEQQFPLLKKLCEHIGPESGSCLILKLTPPKFGIRYLRMLLQEALMVHVLRKTRSSGTLRGSLPIDEYQRFGITQGFNVERFPVPGNAASEILRFSRQP